MHVIATAGHVDHGKSTLIRALTGMEPDRWAEERRRGMTIDLGYAWTVLPSGAEVAFVDVPGHQRFITSMLAGVGPVPAVLLVVAADEGWCRQTAEHLAALDALDVRHGLLAVTRSDLGDADLAIEEARDYLAGTSLEGIEAVAVSAVAGTGIDELRVALDRLVDRLPSPPATATRLWVDRVFTIRGAGTVATGTLASGTIAVGDDLLISSTQEVGQIRSMESLKRSVPSASAVARVALNLRGLDRSEIRRGDALVRAGEWVPVSMVDVRLTAVTQRPPQRPVMHVGSAAVEVHFRRLDDDTARLSWEVPLPLHVGERVILRNPGTQHVFAGAVVLDVLPPRFALRGAAARRARQLADMSASPDAAAEVARRGVIRRSLLTAMGVLDPGADPPEGVVRVGDWLVDPLRWTRWQHDLGSAVEQWRSTHRMSVGMPASAAVQALGLPDPALLTPLVAADANLVSDRDGVHPSGAAPTVSTEAQAGLDQLRERLRAHPFGAPEADELRALGLDARQLAIAVRNGHLVAVGPGIYLLPEALDRAAEVLRELAQPFTLSQARQVLDTTRRVAVPLLELLDRQRVTVRVDASLRTVR